MIPNRSTHLSRDSFGSVSLNEHSPTSNRLRKNKALPYSKDNYLSPESHVNLDKKTLKSKGKTSYKKKVYRAAMEHDISEQAQVSESDISTSDKNHMFAH